MLSNQLSDEMASLLGALDDMVEQVASRRSIPSPLHEETEPRNLVAVDRGPNPYAERIATAMLKAFTSRAQQGTNR
jgi:hypothetical protein